jgi:hypothetical protein
MLPYSDEPFIRFAGYQGAECAVTIVIGQRVLRGGAWSLRRD